MADKLLKLGITQGDINGVGYEIILKLFSDVRVMENCIPVFYGSSKILSYYKKHLGISSINVNAINVCTEAVPGRLNVINCVDDSVKVEFGKATPDGIKSAFCSLECVLKDATDGKLDGLITSPVSENAIKEQFPDFIGQAEYINGSINKGGRFIRILVKDAMRIGLLTDKIDFKEIHPSVTKENLKSKLRQLKKALVRDFSVTNPRIAVLSLNPDSYVGGELKKEEGEIILPAIREALDEGIMCVGPYASDYFFSTDRYRSFDAVLAMYYEQAELPFKTLSYGSGAEYLSGLPLIVAAPCNEVDYEHAGANVTSEDSMRNALYLSYDIDRHRKFDDDVHFNPLKKQYFEKGSDNEILDLTKE